MVHARKLAKLLGGELEVHSEAGQGSTFTLYLPYSKASNSPESDIFASENQFFNIQEHKRISQEEIDESQQKRVDTQSSPIPPIQLKTAIIDDRMSLNPQDKSILIIEEDHQFTDTLIKLAHEKGFKCLIATEGKSGLQIAAHYQPNAILLDINLPQIDGWTVMEWLKDNSNTRHIPVHLVSDSDQSLDAKKRGAIGYLHKPVSLKELGIAFKNIEQFIVQKVKHLLLVVDNKQHQETILEIVGGDDIETTLVMKVEDVSQHLHQAQYDCIIFDVDIEQGSGIERCERLHSQDNLSQIPIIFYANRELSREEQCVLQRCDDNLPVKAVRSPERLLDEATLFLHQVEANLSKEKRNMLRMIHEKATILMQKKVLIVDDDMRNAYALATLLEDKEMEIVVAPNGKEALSMLEKHQDITIILIDMMMPEMDGYEAMQKIRQLPQYQKLPIIALTAKAMKSDKAKCIEAGANDYLSKPIDIDKLISLMRVWLYQ